MTFTHAVWIRLGLSLVLAAALLGPGRAAAQATGDPPAGAPGPDTSARADTLPGEPLLVSPRTAFVRSLLVPGWGQASLGHYTRGAFYLAAQSASGYMMLRMMGRVGEARQVERQWTTIVEDSLRLEMERDPELEEELSMPGRFREAVEAHPAIQDAQALVDSRRRQREDWITWTIFWTLASGVDAFVAAHLADFPPDITAEPAAGGGLRLRVSFPLGGVP